MARPKIVSRRDEVRTHRWHGTEHLITHITLSRPVMHWLSDYGWCKTRHVVVSTMIPGDRRYAETMAFPARSNGVTYSTHALRFDRERIFTDASRRAMHERVVRSLVKGARSSWSY